MRSGQSIGNSQYCFTVVSLSWLPMRSVCFPADLERQHLKLMDMIAAIVGALDQQKLFQSLIHHTGRQHAILA